MNNKYLADFQYVGSSIRSLKIRNDFITLNNNDKAKRDIIISHKIESVETINDNSLFSGILLLNIKVTISAAKKKYIVDLTIEGCFNAPIEIGEDTFKEMLQLNGITSLYSIARGVVQSTTSQTLAAGNVLLPMFNVAAYSKDLNEKE